MWTRLVESPIWCYCCMPLCGVGLRKGTVLLPGLWSFVWEETVSWHSPWYHTLQFLPTYHWCFSSCSWGAGVQREWVYISPKSIVGPLRRDAWESNSFLCHPNPHWFLQPEVMGTYLPGTGTLGWMIWSGAGITHSQGILSNFYPLHMHMGPPILHLCVSTPPTHLDECDFFNSLVVGLPYSLISDDSGW